MQENTLKFVYSGKKEGFFCVCVWVVFFFWGGGLNFREMATQTALTYRWLHRLTILAHNAAIMFMLGDV